MVEIPDTDPVANKIYDYSQAKRGEPYGSIGISLSMLGSDCNRAPFYAFRWATPPKQFDGKMCRLFETGEIHEERLLEGLAGAGATVITHDPDTGRQMRVRGVGGHARGLLDGVAHNVPGIDDQWVVVECKSHNQKSWDALIKKGLKEHKPEHFIQCQSYMHLTGYKKCLYLAVNKNTDAVMSIVIDYDQGFCEHLFNRVESIVYTDDAPSRVSDDPDFWSCRFCDYKNICKGGEFVQTRSCRTCIHVTPLAHKDYGSWQCEKHSKPLNRDEQLAGCEGHLFNPCFVPGEQIDADPDAGTITYALDNGETFIDGPPEAVGEDEKAGRDITDNPENRGGDNA